MSAVWVKIISSSDLDTKILDCDKTLNFKYYNHLIGIHNRASHLNISEVDELSVNVEGGNQHAVMDDDGRLHCGT